MVRYSVQYVTDGFVAQEGWPSTDAAWSSSHKRHKRIDVAAKKEAGLKLQPPLIGQLTEELDPPHGNS